MTGGARSGWNSGKEGEEELLKAAAGMNGVVVERLHETGAVWAIRYPKREGLVRKAVALLEAVKPHAFSVAREDSLDARFSREPALTRLSGHEAAHLLLPELKREPEGLRAKPGRHFMQLVDLLSPIPCWRLTTGYLDRMRDLAASTLQQ